MSRLVLSGFCGLFHQPGDNYFDVVMTTPEQSGGPAHFATLSVESHELLKGSPDFIVGDSQSERIFACWSLNGCKIRIADRVGSSQVIDSAEPNWCDFDDEKDVSWRSLKLLPDFREIGGSSRLSPADQWPRLGDVRVSGGNVRVMTPSLPKLRKARFNFMDQNNQLVWPEVRPMGLQTEVMYQSPVVVDLERPGGERQSIEIAEGVPAVIAVAAAGTGAQRSHGDVVYNFYVSASKRERIKQASMDAPIEEHHFPSNPDECGNFRVQFDF